MITSQPPLLLHVFPSFAVGGAQTRFASIANRFGRAFRHAIIAMDGDLTCSARLGPDLDVVFPAASFRKQALLHNVRQCRHLMRELQPSVLITSNWGSIEWAIANLRPLVRHLHMEDGFGPEERHTQLRRRVLTRRLALNRSTVVLPSRTLLRIATTTWRLDPQRLRYIPNGVDLTSGEEGESRPALWPEDDLPVIGTVAVLRAEKNLPRLLRAFGKLAVPARLVIVGDGPARLSLEELSQQLGIRDRVHFLGYVGAPQRLYRCFDVFALSSDTEQMPLSVLEAMSASLAVASTDVGDVRDMLAPENDRYIVPCSDDALTEGLTRLLANPAERCAIGIANRIKAEHDYNRENMFCLHENLWSGRNNGV